MTNKYLKILALSISAILLYSCSSDKDSKADNLKIYKGLYVFGPELKTLTDCRDGIEYWVTDSSSTLELSYSELNFEKPYEPVYVEVEGNMIETNALESQDFDSTIIVRKVLTISKEVPAGQCID